MRASRRFLPIPGALCLAVLVNAPASQGMPCITNPDGNPKWFSDEVIADAKELVETALNGMSSGGVKFLQSDLQSPKLAGISYGLDEDDGQSKWFVTFYPKQVAKEYPDIKLAGFGVSGFHSGFAKWIAAALLFHELLHKCHDSWPVNPAKNSCEHAAIDFGVHEFMCQSAESLAQLIADEEDPDVKAELQEELTAICSVAMSIEDYWNDPDHATKMAQCASGTTGSNPGFTPQPGCPGALFPPPPVPPAPTSTGYPNDEAQIMQCPACEGVL